MRVEVELLADRVQVMFDPIPSSIGIRAGKLRGLAVTAAQPVAVLPDLPTVGQTVPGYEVVGTAVLLNPKAASFDAQSKVFARRLVLADLRSLSLLLPLQRKSTIRSRHLQKRTLPRSLSAVTRICTAHASS
jgi:hypothetical protein